MGQSTTGDTLRSMGSFGFANSVDKIIPHRRNSAAAHKAANKTHKPKSIRFGEAMILASLSRAKRQRFAYSWLCWRGERCFRKFRNEKQQLRCDCDCLSSTADNLYRGRRRRDAQSLRWLVETLGVPVKTFRSAEVFLGEYDGQVPGCLVVDVRMPGMSGLDLQRELRRRGDEIPVIVLTGYGSVPDVVEALKHGATEFLEKPFDNEVLLETIQRALTFDARRRAEVHEHRVVHERMERLTPREHEVLWQVVDGLSSKEIAARLSMSFKTVEAHLANIMRKMEVESVAS